MSVHGPRVSGMPLAAWTTLLGSSHVVSRAGARVSYVTGADGRDYVLKQPMSWDPDAPRLRLAREFRLLAHLHGSGIPIALPIVADDGNICAETDGELYVLLPKIPHDSGDPEERPDAAEVYRRVGSAIAELHQALASCPVPLSSYELVIDARIKPETFQRVLAADPALAAKLDRLYPAMRAATAGLPQRLTHGDCHDGNLLLRDGHVVGFIDLDHLTTTPRICDIIRWLGNRILWALQAPDERWPTFLGLVDALLAGYSAVSPLSERELTALGPALLVNELDSADWEIGEGHEPSTYAGLIGAAHWLADRGAVLR